MKMLEGKRAIALVSLVLIIIVLMMVAGIVSYVSYDMIAESKKTVFSKDITAVNDAAHEYYAVNGSFPILEGGIELTATEYEQKINDLGNVDNLDILIEEITLNGDLESSFYELDMSKLGIEDSKFGVKNDADDVFLISSNNVIYYLPGYKISRGTYFSSVRITDKGNQ